MDPIVIGISGASGTILALRTIEALSSLGVKIELVISPAGAYTASFELGKAFGSPKNFFSQLSPSVQKNVRLHSINDVGASIGSGSYKTAGMVIVPCSMATVAALAVGLADNCLRRAADVTLKEKKPLIVVPREAPLRALHLENLLRISKEGATVIPPVPAWYLMPQSLKEVEDFIVGKILDALHISHNLYPQWEGKDRSLKGDIG